MLTQTIPWYKKPPSITQREIFNLSNETKETCSNDSDTIRTINNKIGKEILEYKTNYSNKSERSIAQQNLSNRVKKLLNKKETTLEDRNIVAIILACTVLRINKISLEKFTTAEYLDKNKAVKGLLACCNIQSEDLVISDAFIQTVKLNYGRTNNTKATRAVEKIKDSSEAKEQTNQPKKIQKVDEELHSKDSSSSIESLSQNTDQILPSISSILHSSQGNNLDQGFLILPPIKSTLPEDTLPSDL